MRMIKTAALALAASAAITGAAQAAPAPTIIYANGVYSVPTYTSAGIFESFSGATVGQQYTAAMGSGAYGEGVAGDVTAYTGNVPGDGVDPNPGSNQYLAIQNGTFAVNFGSAGVQVLSFDLGSLDSYNSVTLFFSDNSTQTLTGADIIGQPVTFDGNGNSSLSGTNAVSGRVTYDTGGAAAITGVQFSSTSAAFEIDDLAAAAPEPAAWALMILGFGVVGSQLRARRRSGKGFGTKLSMA